VPILWSWMLAQGVHIQFAHRTFVWQSAAKGKAAVHCVIVGFGLDQDRAKTIFEYETVKDENDKRLEIITPIPAQNINPYLVDAANAIVDKKNQPICPVSPMRYGSKPADGGFLILKHQEKSDLLSKQPDSVNFIKEYIGSFELINNQKRYCIWLDTASPNQIRSLTALGDRIASVQKFRQASTDANTRKWADKPYLFQTNRQPQSNYLAIPEVSSENRFYLPIGFLDASIIASNLLYTIADATLYEFGIMTSIMHNAWMRTTCGRLKSDYRYSASIVYNNFPWPLEPSDKQKTAIETAAQAVLDARAAHPDSSLADLYDPLSMPPNLTRAHQQLDKAVDAAYGKTKFATEAERVAFLFELYQQYTAPTAPMTAAPKPKTRRKTAP
jgi:hypothetical protein